MIDKKENVTPNFLKISSCTNPTTGKTLEFVDKKPAVMALVINEKQEILMVKQYRCGADAEVREFVAGVIEDGQTPEDALYAELRQEAGIEKEDINSIHFVNKLYSSVGWTNEIGYTFIVEVKPGIVQKEQKLDEGEKLTYEWLTIQEVTDYLIKDNLNVIVPAKTAFLILYMMLSIYEGQLAALQAYLHKEKQCSCESCDSCKN